MDNATKQILNEIKRSAGQSIYFSGIEDPFCNIASPGVVEASISYLSEHEFITVQKDEFGNLQKISVSYKAIHPIRYYSKKLSLYILSNWIAIVALIISILALLKQ